MMNKIAFTILRGILWFLALMPFWLLYLLSDFLFVVIYYVVRYRRQVTIENLRKSFPEKTEKERQLIARKYYRNLADIVLEFIKIEHITRKTVDKRMVIRNPEILTKLYQSNKNVFITIGHCGNWEWLGKKIALSTKHNAFAVIKPIHDPFFNNYMTQLRVRFHSPNLIDYKKTFRVLSRVNNTINAVVIASDQTPTKGESNFWATFLNQDTAFFLGVEKISKALDYAVLFFDIQRVKRGYYEITIHTISLEPRDTANEEITRRYIGLLESAICQNPDNWLWSHRRWKHKKPIDFS